MATEDINYACSPIASSSYFLLLMSSLTFSSSFLHLRSPLTFSPYFLPLLSPLPFLLLRWQARFFHTPLPRRLSPLHQRSFCIVGDKRHHPQPNFFESLMLFSTQQITLDYTSVPPATLHNRSCSIHQSKHFPSSQPSSHITAFPNEIVLVLVLVLPRYGISTISR